MAEIFEPGQFNLGQGVELFVISIPALRSWDDAAIVEELTRMKDEGLVTQEDGYYRSTVEGQIARERILQAGGYRAACLRDQRKHDVRDLALALVVARHIGGRSDHTEDDDTLTVYLHEWRAELKTATEALVDNGYVHAAEGWGSRKSRRYYPTGKGLRYYDDAVRERLGLSKRRSILDVNHEPTIAQSPFKTLEFKEHLGDGAYADVWKARDPILEREVAVKVFSPSETGNAGALEHARALARVRHNNVVVVHEVVTTTNPNNHEDVVEAVVMELIEGETLAQRLTRGARFSPDEARRIGHAVLDGVCAIHSSGLGHCDLHEGNVLLDRSAGAKVIDILHRGLFADLSTRTRTDYVARDAAAVRELLGLIIRHTDLDFSAGFAFRESTRALRSLDGLQAALDSALCGAT